MKDLNKVIKSNTYRSEDLVKSCPRLESGLRLGIEGVRACQLGAFASPIFWSADEAAQIKITKEMIVEKRKWLFGLLNDEESDITCSLCHMVRRKRFADVDFTQLGQIDLAATTLCNLRCKYCNSTIHNWFFESKYDDLAILREFRPLDVQWDSAVDFNGGEPSLLKNLDEYLDFFSSRRIQVRFMTNGVKFHQSVFDGLADGSIHWVVTSLDAETPSTYLRLKQRDYYLQVLENLTRYAYAGSQNGGRLAVKYIFCSDNCSDDDIAGFTYAMLAIRPHQIWLTFDFVPLQDHPIHAKHLRNYDYSKDVAAYAKMHALMKKHGLNPVNYTESHLAAVCQQGKTLLDQVQQTTEMASSAQAAPELILNDFRRKESTARIRQTPFFIVSPLRIKMPQKNQPLVVTW